MVGTVAPAVKLPLVRLPGSAEPSILKETIACNLILCGLPVPESSGKVTLLMFQSRRKKYVFIAEVGVIVLELMESVLELPRILTVVVPLI